MADNPNLLLAFFGIFFLFLGLAFVAVLTLNFIPAFNIAWLNTWVNNTFTIIDDMVVAVIFIVLIADSMVSWYKPSMAKAFLNVLGIFLLGYINLTFLNLVNGILPFYTGSFPHFYAIISSGAIAFIFYFFMIVSIIFNVRGEKHGV